MSRSPEPAATPSAVGPSSAPSHEARFTPYPAAPWSAHGRAWIGLFRADHASALPRGMTPLLGARWRVVGLVRYLPGSTLTYDELFAGVPVRVGRALGLYVDAMYVSDLAALWGGRCLWSLPKQYARFTWHGDRCTVDAEGELIATLTVNRHISWWPTLPGALCAFGTYGLSDGRVAALPARMRARLGRAGMRLEAWGPRFTYRLPLRPALALGCKPFQATFPPAFEIAAPSR